MRAASLLIVFALTKLAILSGHTIAPSLWMPVAYLWRDLLVVLLFGAVESTSPRWLTGLLYWAASIYAAVNIPVGRAVFTPLTWPMLEAARGPLADSLRQYVNWQNAVLVVAVLAVAAFLPLLLRALPAGVFPLAAAGACIVVSLGPAASARVDTFGMERNAIATLVTGMSPRVAPYAVASNWRVSHAEGSRIEDLSGLRAIAKGRNIVLVSLESTAAQYLELYGSGYPVMPNLSALARRALVFENAYAVYPESIKGLFSVLCSTFPALDSRTERYANAPCRSLAEVLASAGYRTALFHSGRFAYLGMESIVRNRGYEVLEDAGDIGGNHNSSFGVDEPATVSRILSWIDALPRGQRFFLTYLPIAGHHPYATPERGPFPEPDDIGRYRNALHYGDISLGTLIDGLRARGLGANTVWIVFGDHGEAFGQHEGNYGHTFFLYEENVHVPLVIAADGPAPQRVRKVVSLVDLAPTILDLAGLASPENYQGRSMLASEPRMALFFADYSLGMLGLRDGPWKFIYELDSGRSRMFDLDLDRGESVDLAARNAGRAADYGRVVRAWSGAQASYVARWNR